MADTIFYDASIKKIYENLLAEGVLEESDKQFFIDISKEAQSLAIDQASLEKHYMWTDKSAIAKSRPSGPTLNVSLPELLQFKLDQSYQKLLDKIKKIEEERKITVDVNDISNYISTIQKLITATKNSCDEILKELPKIKSYHDYQEFKTYVSIYAQERRHLTKELKLECQPYRGKLIEESEKSRFQTHEEICNEMAKEFFKTAAEKGYDLEQSSITIAEKEYKLADVYESKSERDDLIKTANTNEAKLREQSHLNQASIYFDSPRRQETFKSWLEEARAKKLADDAIAVEKKDAGETEIATITGKPT